jgi:hypothetical protein
MYPQVKHSDDVCSKKPDAYVTELSLEMDSKMLLELLSEYGFSNYLMNGFFEQTSSECFT